jgi:hypothetical protein
MAYCIGLIRSLRIRDTSYHTCVGTLSPSPRICWSLNDLSSPPNDPLPGAGDASTSSAASAISPAEASHFSARSLLLALFAAGIGLLLLLVTLKVLFGQRLPPLEPDSLEHALGQWRANGPSSYDLDVHVGGAQPGRVHVEVRNGQVTTATRDGRPLPDRGMDVWSIPGQFEMLEREFEFAENPQREMQAPQGARLWLRCAFDPKFGYPLRFHRFATGGAPEVYWENSLRPQ